MYDFIVSGSQPSIEVEWNTGIGRVEAETDAVIDVDKCCRFFDELDVGCERIEVYQGHLLTVVALRNPVLGWIAERKGQC